MEPKVGSIGFDTEESSSSRLKQMKSNNFVVECQVCKYKDNPSCVQVVCVIYLAPWK